MFCLIITCLLSFSLHSAEKPSDKRLSFVKDDESERKSVVGSGGIMGSWKAYAMQWEASKKLDGTRSVSLGDIPVTSIDVDGIATVLLQDGERNEVAVRCDSNCEKYLFAQVVSGQLRIRQAAYTVPDRIVFSVYLNAATRALLNSIVVRGDIDMSIRTPLSVANLLLANDGTGRLFVERDLTVAGLLTYRLNGRGQLGNKSCKVMAGKLSTINTTDSPTTFKNVDTHGKFEVATVKGEVLYQASKLHIDKGEYNPDKGIAIEGSSIKDKS